MQTGGGKNWEVIYYYVGCETVLYGGDITTGKVRTVRNVYSPVAPLLGLARIVGI